MIVTMLRQLTEYAISCVRNLKQRRVLIMLSITAVSLTTIYFSLGLLLNPGFLEWIIKLHGG